LDGPVADGLYFQESTTGGAQINRYRLRVDTRPLPIAGYFVECFVRTAVAEDGAAKSQNCGHCEEF